MTKLTDELRGFYAAYSAWINAGAQTQTGTIFRRTHGLCACAYDYFSAIGVDVESPLEAMHEAFVAGGLNEKLPFNENPDHYRNEQARSECHLNPARLAWVGAALHEYQNTPPVDFDTWFRSQEQGRSIVNVQLKRKLQEISWNACRAAMLEQNQKTASTNFRENANLSTEHFRETGETSTKCRCSSCFAASILSGEKSINDQ